MILQSLYIDFSPGRGRGVFTSENLPGSTIIEISPVIVLTAAGKLLLDKTLMHDYIFFWGQEDSQCCVALGYLSMYNHDYQSNAEYEMDFESEIIRVSTVRDIKKGEEVFINYNGNWNDPNPVWFHNETPRG